MTRTPLLIAVDPGHERHLVAELTRAGGAGKILQAGWVRGEAPSGRPLALAFARQLLPEPSPIAAQSISGWAAALMEGLQAHLTSGETPWRLHVFCIERPGGELRAVRCRYIEDELSRRVRSARPPWRTGRVSLPGAPWREGELLFQLALTGPEEGWWSVSQPEAQPHLLPTLSRWSGGQVPLTEDKAPPSRAWQKLVEAQAHLGRSLQAGESCVDLGACPGGWSWVALRAGARVVAVDRSPLREDLMAHPNLEFRVGDAFGYKPPCPVDWLVCDVIATPQRSLQLLGRWLAEGWCRAFVVTLKFQGEGDYDLLASVGPMLAPRTRRFMLRHMGSNKNEVTAMGQVESQEQTRPDGGQRTTASSG